ncbi:DNA invertase Pin-like site-specific DNA recombinase [Desulfitispora alkaliphila]|uniref:recombinase family protein n=1 Tax=Desulfitispora alkaliphila TaxID=622674 RepID=UPI003D21995C
MALPFFSPKAVLYGRVSTEEQASKENSIPAQIHAIKKFALDNGIEVIDEYLDEGKSARTTDRPQFQKMISAAKKKEKEFSIILVHKTDRFARNRSDSVIYKSLLKRECGVDVISVAENFDDSPTGKLLEGMMEVIAEFHSSNLAQEVIKGMSQKASTGVYVGRTPYGYIHNETTKKLEINVEEAKVVKMIFEMYSKGDSFATIKKTLNLTDTFTRQGKLWDSSSIKRIIKNPVYIGKYIWNKKSKSKIVNNDQDDWIVLDNAHEPIITTELFDKAHAVLKSKQTMVGPSMKSRYLLSSIIKCGHCGHNMIGEKKKHVSGKTYYRYVCGNYLNHKMCFYNFVHKEEIEEFIIAEIRKIVSTSTVDSNSVVSIEADTQTPEKGLLEARQKKISYKFQRQLEAYEAGIITLEELQQAKERVALEEAEIQEELKRLEKKSNELDIGEQLSLHFSSFEEVLASNDTKQIKLWLKERVNKIEVFDKNNIKIKYKHVI